MDLPSGQESWAVSPSGETLALASKSQATISLWKFAEGRVTETFSLEAGEGGTIVFSPDGATLAVGHDDSRVTLYERATGKQRLILGVAEQDCLITKIIFHPDGKTLAYYAPRIGWRAYDIKNGDEVDKHLTAVWNESGSRGLWSWSPDGDSFVSGKEKESTVYICDGRTGEERRSLQVGSPDGKLLHTRFTPDGRHLLTVNYNGTVYVLRLD